MAQVGTELLAHDGSKITVTSLEKVKPDHNDQFVYDLVIEPGPEGKFEYFAGSENNSFAIASELPTAKNFSKAEQLAFQVIMKVISDSAEKLNKLYQSSVDHSTYLYEINRIARFIDAGFLHGDRISNGTTDAIPSHEAISPTDLYSLATNFCQAKDGTYNQACDAAYDLFMQELFYPISSSLELGYRLVPKSNSFDYLAIAVNVKLEVPVLLSKEVRGQLTATFFASSRSLHGFIERRTLPLFDENGTEQGYIHVDTRNLHTDHLDTECKKAEEWKESSKQQLALLIESSCKDILAKF